MRIAGRCIGCYLVCSCAEICDQERAIQIRRAHVPMKYLSVLTPPLLVCAVFLVAVGAFLRHEMGARRVRSEDLAADDISAEDPIPGRAPDTQGEDADTSERHGDRSDDD
jgi:hypothetical protein